MSNLLAPIDADPWRVLYEAPAFAQIVETAKTIAQSSIIPTHLRGQLPDIILALAMARAMGENPIIVLQSIYVVSGRASWSAQYLIARVNGSGRIRGPIRWREQGDGDGLAVTAYATLTETGEDIQHTVSMQMAHAEGWSRRNPKYKTMPELMLRYRSATLLARLYFPDVLMGLHERYELIDSERDVKPLKITPLPALPEVRDAIEADARDLPRLAVASGPGPDHRDAGLHGVRTDARVDAGAREASGCSGAGAPEGAHQGGQVREGAEVSAAGDDDTDESCSTQELIGFRRSLEVRGLDYAIVRDAVEKQFGRRPSKLDAETRNAALAWLETKEGAFGIAEASIVRLQLLDRVKKLRKGLSAEDRDALSEAAGIKGKAPAQLRASQLQGVLDLHLRSQAREYLRDLSSDRLMEALEAADIENIDTATPTQLQKLLENAA